MLISEQYKQPFHACMLVNVPAAAAAAALQHFCVEIFHWQRFYALNLQKRFQILESH